MNERALRPASLAAAAITVGGVLMVLFPEHGMSIVRLIVATVAAGAGLYALFATVPELGAGGWWISPFGRIRSGSSAPPGSDELGRIRARFGARRQRVEGGPPLPPGVIRMVQPLIEERLAQVGLDPADPGDAEAIRSRVAPATWALLQAEPVDRVRRWTTLRPREREVVAVVDAALDDLVRL